MGNQINRLLKGNMVQGEAYMVGKPQFVARLAERLLS
jgi:hypothetical protein